MSAERAQSAGPAGRLGLYDELSFDPTRKAFILDLYASFDSGSRFFRMAENQEFNHELNESHE